MQRIFRKTCIFEKRNPDKKKWKDRYCQQATKTLNVPLLISYDDFQILSPIGVHWTASSIGALYIKALCLTPSVSSTLEAILPAQAFYATDNKTVGSQAMFQPLVDELLKICGNDENCLLAIDHSKYDKIAVTTCALEGDNKPMTEAGGFVGAFGNFPCNHCKETKEDF